MVAVKDLSGQKFGRLTGICRTGSTKSGGAVWLFQCECGAKKEVASTAVLSGKSASCGCLQKEARVKHGQYNQRTYMAWQNMKARVGSNPKYRPYYADKGIAVCAEWRNDFARFLADMGECPPGLTLERRDGKKGYEPSNCIWADRATQSANTSRTHRVIVQGVQMCLRDASRITGRSYRTLMKRMARGESAQEALRL